MVIEMASKILGLLFSENLRWTNFIDSVENSAFKKLGLLKKEADRP